MEEEKNSKKESPSTTSTKTSTKDDSSQQQQRRLAQKQVGAVVEVDEDVEMDHLDIVPRQDLKKTKSKTKV